MQTYDFSFCKQARKLGHLAQWAIERAPGGWCIVLSDSAPESAGILALARSTEVRVFRTLEAVIATLQELGFTVERLQAAPVPVPVAATEPDPKPAPLVVPDIALDSVPESEAAPAPVQA